MPLALLLGMALPAAFAPWHRLFTRIQSRVGRGFLAGLLYMVFFLAVTPLAFILKFTGKRFIDSGTTGSSWIPARPHGSLRDQF